MLFRRPARVGGCGIDAVVFKSMLRRKGIRVVSMSDVIFTTEEAMSDDEVEDFYER